MHFAHPIPWWAWPIVLAAAIGLAYAFYARLVVPMARVRRLVLTALRAATLFLLVTFLLGPTITVPPSSAGQAMVPIIVDVSRSMRIRDADGLSRIDRAASIVNDLRSTLAPQFPIEVFTFGETLAPAGRSSLTAQARRSDLSGGLQALRERLEGRTVAAIVVLSDGGDTGRQDVAAAIGSDSPPVLPIGIGAPTVQRDREVLGVAVADAPLAESVVDLSVSAVSHGFGTQPIEVRVSADGKPVETKRITPVAEGSPIRDTFPISPNRASATLVTVEIPSEPGEAATENNRRSVLVSPPGRKRRVLLVEGAPGFEHSFLKRAWAADSGIDVDAVVRKGRNEQGASTYFVQGDASRSAELQRGYPASREALYAYDAIVLGNIEGDFFSQDQLAMTADFVAERGGGLLVLGARSFAGHGLIGTPLEEVLPLELNDRRGGITLTSMVSGGADVGKVTLTADGELHPLMRLARAPEDNRRRWAALPPLSSSVALGGPRPGAQVLAVAMAADGSSRPVVAMQRYGRGRSMIFGGEASWRWRMLMPATDRSYEMFWRQTARWLSTGAPDQVSIVVPGSATPGEGTTFEVSVRDRAFAPVPDAAVTLRVTLPGGEVRDLRPNLADARTGRYAAALTPEHNGVYRVTAQARRGAVNLGSAERWMLVGGSDPEVADPRLNEDVLRRMASVTGGRYFPAKDAGTILESLRTSQAGKGQLERRELWHTPWAFGLIVLLLSTEWTLRRRWGLR